MGKKLEQAIQKEDFKDPINIWKMLILLQIKELYIKVKMSYYHLLKKPDIPSTSEAWSNSDSHMLLEEGNL